MNPRINPTLAAALGYLDLGLAALPLVGKRPVVPDWTRRPPATRRELYRWFYGEESRFNLGLQMGAGLFAIDIDPRNGGAESWRAILDGRDLPPTAEAWTGGGGGHLFFQTPRPIGCFGGFLGRDGVDVKGLGGLVVVEPSVHPETGGPYLWRQHPGQGIAMAPRYLLGLLLGWSTDRESRPRPVPIGRLSDRPARVGDVAFLAAEAIRRFALPGPGTRAGQFARLVPSLVGRGFDDATIEDVVAAWWAHHHALGLCRTDPALAMRETAAYVARLRPSDRFRPATSAIDHRERCRQVEVPAELPELLRRVAAQKKSGEEGAKSNTNTGVTLISGRLLDRACNSADDLAFVEALVILVAYEAERRPGQDLMFTRDQVRQVAADRHPGLAWNNEQFERLKRKFITRPGRPASQLELLVETSKGDRRPGRAVGTPSSYRPTGILALLGAEASDPTPESSD